MSPFPQDRPRWAMTFVLIFQRVLARKFSEQRQLIFTYFESEFHGEHDGGIRFSYRQDEVRCFPGWAGSSDSDIGVSKNLGSDSDIGSGVTKFGIPIPIPVSWKYWVPIPIPIPASRKNSILVPIPIPNFFKSRFRPIPDASLVRDDTTLYRA